MFNDSEYFMVNEEYEKQYVQCEQLCASIEQMDMEKWLQPDDLQTNYDTFGVEFTSSFHLLHMIRVFLMMQ